MELKKQQAIMLAYINLCKNMNKICNWYEINIEEQFDLIENYHEHMKIIIELDSIKKALEMKNENVVVEGYEGTTEFNLRSDIDIRKLSAVETLKQKEVIIRDIFETEDKILDVVDRLNDEFYKIVKT